MIRRPPRSTLFPTRRSSDLTSRGGAGPSLRDTGPGAGSAMMRWAPDMVPAVRVRDHVRSEEHTSELQSQSNLVCRLLLEKKKTASAAFHHRHVTQTHFYNNN